MITFYHSPNSRSTSVLALLHALGALEKVEIRAVSIPRQDGSGGRDPANPHPEGKVPYLTIGDDWLRERGAIFTYLTEAFPEAGLAPLPGQPGRGQFLSWMAYYQGVVEPVLVGQFVGVNHPAWRATFRGLEELHNALAQVLSRQPYLLGAKWSAADLLMASPFLWFPDFTPDQPAIRDWVARCGAHPSVVWAKEADAKAK